jgi:spermidine synthase
VSATTSRICDRSACQILGDDLKRYYVGIFTVSAATLLLELALTRVLSVAMWYHFGFLVISTALLGFGVAGVALSLWPGFRERAPLDTTLSLLSLGFGATTFLSYWLTQKIVFDPFDVVAHRSQLLLAPLYYLIITIPFFFSGLVIALLFSRRSTEVNRLYAFDLLGAGIGCAGLALVMPAFGGAGSVLFAALLGFVGAAVFGWSQARRFALIGVALAVCFLPISFWGDRLMPISVIATKVHPLEPTNSRPILTAWSSLSKVDVFKIPAAPDSGRPRDGLSIIVDAGAAGTAIPDLSSGVREYLANSDDFRHAGYAYLGKQHPKVLIIGSGAGREVLEGLAYGADSVTAVEINPVINQIATETLRPYWGGLFEQPEVHLVTEDGRSFVRRSHDRYDAIISVQTMSDAALLSGAMTLSETYILTREAFEDYYDHLTPNGVLMMTRPKHQIPKLITTARELFDERGLGNAADHILVFRGPVLPYGHTEFLTCFLMKKSEWDAGEIAAIEKRLGVGDVHASGSEVPEIYYAPHQKAQESAYARHLSRVATAPDLQALYRGTTEALAPATDDKPFFNQRLQWRFMRPGVFKEVLSSGVTNIDFQPIAEVSLILLFAQVTLIAAVLVLLPLLRAARLGLRLRSQGQFLFYFAGLGLGFIMIEMVLLQKFTLFLGQPAYTLAVILASLLISTGIGSYATSRFRNTSRWSLFPVVILILTAVGITALATPSVLAFALGFALPWRILISVVLVTPFGFLLGMPFPMGLRLLEAEAPNLLPWAWGVNAFATVVGSVGSVILAMALGFRVVFAAAAACYLLSLASLILPELASLALGQRHTARILDHVQPSTLDSASTD